MILVLELINIPVSLNIPAQKPVILQFIGLQTGVQSVTGNLVTGTPANPIINQSVSNDFGNDAILGTDGLVFVPERVQSVTGDSVDNTDPLNPIIKSVANLSFYPTTAASDIPTYVKLVTNITDPDYDDPAVNIPTGAISGTGQLLSSLAAAPGVFIGNPGVINIETVGEIRRTSGTGLAEFYFEAYHRDSLGTETLIGTSNNTAPVSVNVYTQFQASLLLNNGVFTATDRLVLKFYGNRIAGGSNPSYDFLFGGTTPVRTLFPIAAGLISNVQSVNGFTGVVVLNASDVGALATVAVDGVTITGDGTVGNPLVSVGGGGGGLDQLQVVLNSQVYS
jgi:hypothetical protein